MQTLNQLTEGVPARVLRLAAEGSIRCRLLDIGLIPGTSVTCVQRGTGIAAYRVRSTVIALRDRDAAEIFLEPIP